MDEARRTRDACPANEKTLESLQRTQAQAELHFLRAEFEEAGSLAAALRERHPPLSRRGIWMRPWMLSLLLAHSTGDTAAEAALAAELDGFANKLPLSRCLATPNEVDCLAIL